MRSPPPPVPMLPPAVLPRRDSAREKEEVEADMADDEAMGEPRFWELARIDLSDLALEEEEEEGVNGVESMVVVVVEAWDEVDCC